jgi:hypothetical protein
MAAKKIESNTSLMTEEKTLKKPRVKASAKTTSPKETQTEMFEEVKATPSQEVSTTKKDKKGPKTRITVKYDVGFDNHLFIRGQGGAHLNWDHGVMLKNTGADEWVWETDLNFDNVEFKMLINDRQYEMGSNHGIKCGESLEYTPDFYEI